MHVERGQESKLEASERNGVTTAGYLQEQECLPGVAKNRPP